MNQSKWPSHLDNGGARGQLPHAIRATLLSASQQSVKATVDDLAIIRASVLDAASALHQWPTQAMDTKEAEDKSLAELGKETFHLFHTVLITDEKPFGVPSDAMTLRRINSEADRFKLWAANLGLLVPGHGSLDYRVREAEGLASTLRSFLFDLNQSLEEGKLLVVTISLTEAC